MTKQTNQSKRIMIIDDQMPEHEGYRGIESRFPNANFESYSNFNTRYPHAAYPLLLTSEKYDLIICDEELLDKDSHSTMGAQGRNVLELMTHVDLSKSGYFSKRGYYARVGKTLHLKGTNPNHDTPFLGISSRWGLILKGQIWCNPGPEYYRYLVNRHGRFRWINGENPEELDREIKRLFDGKWRGIRFKSK